MDKTEPRFSFPNYTQLRQADTDTYEVEIGIVEVNDGFVVHLLRRKGLTFEGHFLLAKVFDRKEEKLLWSFPKNYIGCIGMLAAARGEPTVAFVGNGKEGKVEEIMPFSMLMSKTPMDLRLRLEFKRQAAEFLNRKYQCSAGERKLIEVLKRRREEEERAAKAAAHEARQKARAELVARLLARSNIEVYTSQGYKRYGVPVVGDEWMSLPHNTLVVRVASYDESTNAPGLPIEAFQVTKEKGKNPVKGSPAPVTLERPVIQGSSSTEAMPSPTGEVIVEMASGVYEVSVYATMADVRKARQLGLNGGQYVTAKDKITGNRYEVFSVRKDGVETLGLFTPIA